MQWWSTREHERGSEPQRAGVLAAVSPVTKLRRADQAVSLPLGQGTSVFILWAAGLLRGFKRIDITRFLYLKDKARFLLMAKIKQLGQDLPSHQKQLKKTRNV